MESKVKHQTQLEKEMRESLEAQMKYNIEQDEIKEKKKREMVNYKQQLDKQMGVKKRQAMYGNMTGVEKQLNKEELEAYKNYEKGNHFLPGFDNKPAKEHKPHKHTD